MFKVNYKVILLAFAIVMIFGGFYWWQLRPVEIRKRCANEVEVMLKQSEEKHDVLDWQRLYDLKFETCINKRGLK